MYMDITVESAIHTERNLHGWAYHASMKIEYGLKQHFKFLCCINKIAEILSEYSCSGAPEPWTPCFRIEESSHSAHSPYPVRFVQELGVRVHTNTLECVEGYREMGRHWEIIIMSLMKQVYHECHMYIILPDWEQEHPKI